MKIKMCHRSLFPSWSG